MGMTFEVLTILVLDLKTLLRWWLVNNNNNNK